MVSDEIYELPKRAQIGYVLKNATLHQGEWSPSTVFWILQRHGLVDEDDLESTMDLIEDVMHHSTHTDWTKEGADGG